MLKQYEYLNIDNVKIPSQGAKISRPEGPGTVKVMVAPVKN